MNEARIADMISKIAHELRSPLTSVKGFSSMLLSRWDRFTDEQRRQFVETIHADAERMGRIVSEVLDLARLEANRLELHPEVVDVDDLFRRAAGRLSDLPGVERIEYRGDRGISVWADPERLESVLGQLLENAVKYSDDGAIIVSVDDSDGGVTLRVSDRGIGIDPARIEEVFAGPAPRGNWPATPSGAGLGLYLSRGLVEAHGGTISVESQPDRGSTFSVWLPGRPERSDG